MKKKSRCANLQENKKKKKRKKSDDKKGKRGRNKNGSNF